MSKSIFLPLFALLLLLGACRSLRLSDYHSTGNVREPLPRLHTLVHKESFLSAFDDAAGREFYNSIAITGPDFGPDPWVMYSLTDQSLKDVYELLQNQVNENVNRNTGPEYGDARFKLKYYRRKNSGWGYTIPSVGTLFAANILGMPFNVKRSELELQMEITDANKKVIASYTATGVGKATVAAYYGYDAVDASRKSNLLALEDAMGKIKIALAQDSGMLKERLDQAGPKQ